MVSVSNNMSYGGIKIEPKVKKGDIKTLVKYVNGESLNTKPDTFAGTMKNGVSSAAVFEGVPLALLMKRNKKIGGKFYSDEMRALQAEVNAAKKSGLKNYMKKIGELQEKYGQLKTEVKTQYRAEHGITAKIKKLFSKTFPKTAEKAGIQSVKTASETVANATKEVTKEVAEEAAKGTGKAGGKIAGKIAGKLNGKFGGTFIGKAAGKLKNGLKTSGAGIMLAIDGGIEFCSEVVPTFKELGVKKGMKQLGKSTVKVAANTAGYIAGAKLGSAIGTAICPGIGTAVGAAVGFVGGMLGSFVAGKITKSVVGKNEREIANEKNQKATVNQISKDNDKIKELQLAALQRIQEEAAMNGGQLSEDSLAVLKAIENIGEIVPLTEADLAANPFAQVEAEVEEAVEEEAEA